MPWTIHPRSLVLLGPLSVGLACGDDGSPAASGTSNGPTEGSTSTGADSTGTPSDTSTTEDPDSSESGETTSGPEVCGDGIPQGLEQCDDGNDVPDDGCDPGCVLPPGTEVWTATLDGEMALDEAHGIVATPSGELVVVGQLQLDSGGRDLWLAAYDLAGQPLWSRTHDLGDGQDDVGIDLAVTASGSLAVVGWVEIPVAGGADDDDDILLAEFDPKGDLVASYTFPGPDQRVDRGTSIAIDGAGDHLLAGRVDTNDQDDQIWFAKVDAGGNIVWEQLMGGAGGSFDSAESIAVAPDGGFAVVGTIDQGGGPDLWISRRDTDGNELWADTVDGGFGAEAVNAAAFADDGTLYVAGGLANALTNGDDVWVRHYDAMGAELWTSTWNAMSFDDDVGRGLALASDDSVFVTGSTTTPGQQLNVLTTRMDALGERWVDGHDGGSMLLDTANAAVSLPDDSVVVVGAITVVGEGTNAWLRRYAG